MLAEAGLQGVAAEVPLADSVDQPGITDTIAGSKYRSSSVFDTKGAA